MRARNPGAVRRNVATPLDQIHPTPLAMPLQPAPFVERRDLKGREALRRRVISEFDEMPGLRLTFWQATRLFGIEEAVGNRLLRQLVAEGILSRNASGLYVRRDPRP